jgi:spore maturation protein CgeB
MTPLRRAAGWRPCDRPLRIVILGLSITSSWGNGHATTYRALVRALADRGHDVLFLERDVPWYAANRDLPRPPFGRVALYASLDELKRRFRSEVEVADLVMLGSYVPEGIAAGEWLVEVATGVTTFYDIDTPVTVAALREGTSEYVSADLVPRFDLYLSFTGGPILERLRHEFGARDTRPLYCGVDPGLYHPEPVEFRWDIGYLGTYSDDRQPAMARLLLEPAQCAPDARFVIAGPQYPPAIRWPRNVERIEHLPPGEHRAFYNAQRFTVNVTRAQMVRTGYSASVRLFEAAACATPIISDAWEGLETFFAPEREILVAHSGEDTLRYLRELPEAERLALGQRARARVLAQHTAAHRARQLEEYFGELFPSAGSGAARG